MHFYIHSSGSILVVLMMLCTSAQVQGAESPFGSINNDLNSLRGDIYYLEEGAPSLPDFSSLTPVGTIYTRTLDVPERSFTNGFPGVTDRFEWFAIRYTGSFQVDSAGDYGFRLVSDDGSRLLIDGKKIIDNDGQHPPQSQSGSVYLQSGLHQIEVDYFQGPREYVALQLFWTVPGGTETISDPRYVPGSFTGQTSSQGRTPSADGRDLTGIWDCNDGGTYYIRQSEDVVWWFGEPSHQPGGWSNDGKGTITADTINLDWSDVPKGRTLNGGTLVLKIESNDRLTASAETGGFGGSVWTRRSPTSNAVPPADGMGLNGFGTSGQGPTSSTGGASSALASPWEDAAVRSLIDEWILQQDNCLKNVYGPGAYIDKWGRACGVLTTATISCDIAPDHPMDWDNYHYLWYNNWCPDYYSRTVRDYVQQRESGRSFEDLADCKDENEVCY
jgi:hypothetical protein